MLILIAVIGALILVGVTTVALTLHRWHAQWLKLHAPRRTPDAKNWQMAARG